MIKIVCTVVDLRTPDYNHLGYIRFDLDDGKDFCYRSRVSYEYFAQGRKFRNRRPGEFQYGCRRETEMTGYFSTMDPALPIVDVANLWEFYKHINYDYKRQKWI